MGCTYEAEKKGTQPFKASGTRQDFLTFSQLDQKTLATGQVDAAGVVMSQHCASLPLDPSKSRIGQGHILEKHAAYT